MQIFLLLLCLWLLFLTLLFSLLKTPVLQGLESILCYFSFYFLSFLFLCIPRNCIYSLQHWLDFYYINFTHCLPCKSPISYHLAVFLHDSVHIIQFSASRESSAHYWAANMFSKVFCFLEQSIFRHITLLPSPHP